MTPPTDTQRAPWEIPIREPEPGAPEPERPRVGRRIAALAVLGVLCFLATTAILGWLLDDGGTDEALEDQTPTSSAITFAPRSDASSTTAPPATSTTTSSTTTTAPPTTTTAPPTTTTAPPGAGTGSVPELSASYGGGWAAMLTSVPYSVGTQGLEAAYAEVRGAVPGAVATRGERWSSVADGYWVLLEPGPFASAEAVESFCASVEGARTDCAARRLVP
ncbi:MAG TPA: hypothetical protein VFU14_16040 [Acidimicrobiales bacterium]|nr:hypothetical protein [Acidimicrobiales bacterium]